ncbi:lasso RiPP family leader peptide-containing protein [Lacihabitans soyangensis]|uniref:Lasso RiPP family leader peptide-containing protein n=1 Tax=Lacihabitans soyangensis TaxID=869394 RepID=A0AAE3H367_9BACT|nr:lasso RiPP family leader peptide-containing protein [Lacihabitans soyangensis]
MIKKTKKMKYETPKLKRLGDVKKITLKTGSTTDFGEQGFV